MKLLKNVFDFYINSSIHLSLAIVCMAAVTYLNFRIAVDYGLLIFIFLASITGYNFIKYAGIAKFHHFSLTKNLRIIQVFSFLVFLGLLISAFFQPLPVLLFAGVMAVFTGLYALPVLYRRKSLRKIPGLKIYIIAFVVAAVTVLMPLIPHPGILQWDVFLEFLQRFFIVIALVLPFEIRDLKFDMAELGTIPQVMGVAGTRKIGYFLIGFFIFLEVFKGAFDPAYLISLLALAIMTYLSLKNAVITQGRYYASFWVEAVPIFWFLSYRLLTGLI